MRKTSVNHAILLFALITQAGCFKLGRDTPVLRQYVLPSGGVRAEAAAPQRVGGTTIGVRRLDLATYLASPAIVIRRGARQIETSEFHRWGEDPLQGINRALAAHLATLPSVGAVDVAPWAPRTPHDYLLQLHVLRFEGVADEAATTGDAQLFVTWEIITPQDNFVLARGKSDYRQGGWQVGDYGALVTLLDDLLNSLSRDVVACIARLPASVPKASGAVAVTEPLACTQIE
jgi:uncharacterized lipoprotein YmbA